MTTYPIAALGDGVIAYQKPITLQQGRGFRDLTLSVGEADPTVPLSLLPTVLLGTITTTSGTSQSLPGLVLTPFRFLRIFINGVSFTTLTALELAGNIITATMVGSSASTFSGVIQLELATGMAITTTLESGSGATSSTVTFSGYSTATTSIVFTGGTFDAGSILVYGEK